MNEAITVFNSSLDLLMQSRRGQTNLERSIVMYVASRKFGHRLQDIADAFGCSSYSVVGSTIKRLEKDLVTQPIVTEKIDQLERKVRKQTKLHSESGGQLRHVRT